MPATEMILLITIFVAILLGFIHLLRLVGSFLLHRTIRSAIDKDPALAEGLLARMAVKDEDSGDERTAVISVAVGIAMIVASIVIGDPDWMHYGVAAAVFPLIVGTALWLRQVMKQRAARRAAGQ